MALTAADLIRELRLTAGDADTTATVNRLLATTKEMVTREAPLAPESIRDEARIRLAGWLYDAPPVAFSGVRSALSASGAGALLAPYRKRRAGVLGEDAPESAVGPRVPGGAGVDELARKMIADLAAVVATKQNRLQPPSDAEAAAGVARTVRGWTARLVRVAAAAVANLAVQNGVQLWARAAPGNEVGGKRQYPAADVLAKEVVAGHVLTAQPNGAVAFDDPRASLPPYATVRMVPAGLPGREYPIDFEILFSNRITTRQVKEIQVAIAGQTSPEIVRDPTTAIPGTLNGQRALALRYSITERTRQVLANNTPVDATQVNVDITYKFLAGPDVVDRLALPVNNDVFSAASPPPIPPFVNGTRAKTAGFALAAGDIGKLIPVKMPSNASLSATLTAGIGAIGDRIWFVVDETGKTAHTRFEIDTPGAVQVRDMTINSAISSAKGWHQDNRDVSVFQAETTGIRHCTLVKAADPDIWQLMEGIWQ